MDYLKYLVYAMVLYLLFTFVPNNKIYLTDLLTMVMSIMIFNITYDFLEISLLKTYEGYDPMDPNATLSSFQDDESDNRSSYANAEDNELVTDVEIEETETEVEETEDKVEEKEAEKTEVDVEKNIENKDVPVDENVSKNKKSLNNSSTQQEQINDENVDSNDVDALESGNTSNLASFEPTKEDTNKKEALKYKKDIKIEKKEFIPGYSFMHTDYWTLPMKKKPVCKNAKPCKVCPRQTTGFEKDLLKWDVKPVN